MDNTLTNIAGICDVCKIELHDGDSWTEITIPESLVLPKEKPDIEQLISAKIVTRITRKKVIVTPSTERAPNFEGKLLTGRKLIVEGELCQSITYTANLCNQPVHSAHFIVPFSTFIVIPKQVRLIDRISCCERTVDSLFLDFHVTACVENVFIHAINKRQISKNVLLFLQAVPVTTCGCLDEW